MLIDSPLSLRVASPAGEVTLDVPDLTFARSARGGYESATFTVPQWVDSTNPVIAPMSRVKVDDSRTGRRVWEGYLDIPGRTTDRLAGHTWQVGAIGARSVLADRSLAHIVIDRDLSKWQKRFASPGASAAQGTLPSDTTTPVLLMQFPSGQAVGNGSRATMAYMALADAGQKMGGYGYNRTSGIGDANYRTRSGVDIAPGTVATLLVVRDTNLSVTSGTVPIVSATYTTDWTGIQDMLVVQLARTAGGATNVATDSVWTADSAMWVCARLKTSDGSWQTPTVHGRGYLFAHEVVVDALRRFTTMVDLAGVSIDTSFAYQINQMAYPDGTRMSDLLDDLALLEPDIVWEALETAPGRQHRFVLRRYPSDVRYETSRYDGWTSPGGEVDLANSLTVFWNDPAGGNQSAAYTIQAPLLDQWGRVRDADPLQLGTEIGSRAAANRVGPAVLAQSAKVPWSGTLTVARPVFDRYTAQDVMPWEIEPGYLMNVRDIAGPPLRVTEVSYSDADQSASLTLGTPVYSTEEMVAKLTRRRSSRGLAYT